jgi:hypothetical protein
MKWQRPSRTFSGWLANLAYLTFGSIHSAFCRTTATIGTWMPRPCPRCICQPRSLSLQRLLGRVQKACFEPPSHRERTIVFCMVGATNKRLTTAALLHGSSQINKIRQQHSVVTLGQSGMDASRASSVITYRILHRRRSCFRGERCPQWRDVWVVDGYYREQHTSRWMDAFEGKHCRQTHHSSDPRRYSSWVAPYVVGVGTITPIVV